MHILVKDLAVCERPYEKAERYGVSALSDAELLSLIMRTGTKEASVPVSYTHLTLPTKA